MSSASAISHACVGPAPPKAISACSRGSDPLLDGQDPDRVRHVLVADAHHRRRGLQLAVSPSRSPSRASALRRELGVELQLPAEEEVGIQPAQREVGVGDRRLGPALAVAGGTGRGRRHSAGRLAGSRPGRPSRSSRRRPRSSAWGHAGNADREPELELEVRRVQRLAVEDEADITARAARVEGESAIDTGPRGATYAPPMPPPAIPERRRCAGRGPRLRRERPTAVRLQQRPGRVHAGRP